MDIEINIRPKNGDYLLLLVDKDGNGKSTELKEEGFDELEIITKELVEAYKREFKTK